MKKILNPYPKQPGYNCFACSPNNEYGLKMEFYEEADAVVCNWNPLNHAQGYNNMLHGGIQATLIDEIGSWYVQIKLKTAGVTSNLNVRYFHPVYIDKGELFLRATLVRMRRNLADMEVQLFDADKKLCAKGLVTYFTFSKDEAKEKLNYPAYSEFFEKNS